MTTVLLTGATGLVGSRLLPRLAEAGFDCRALVRRDVALPAGTTGVRGDLDDPASLRDGSRGRRCRRPPRGALPDRRRGRHMAGEPRRHPPPDRRRQDLRAAGPLRDGQHRQRLRRRRPAPKPRRRRGHARRPPTRRASWPPRRCCATSDLTWAILRLPFVYGDGDGHIESIPALAGRFGLHPAHTYSVAHHRDIAIAFRLALTGAMDGRIVNITDDAPVTVYELAQYAGNPIKGSAEPADEPVVRPHGRIARAKTRLRADGADHPRSRSRGNPLAP